MKQRKIPAIFGSLVLGATLLGASPALATHWRTDPPRRHWRHDSDVHRHYRNWDRGYDRWNRNHDRWHSKNDRWYRDDDRWHRNHDRWRYNPGRYDNNWRYRNWYERNYDRPWWW